MWVSIWKQNCPVLLNIVRVTVLFWYTKVTKMWPHLVITVPGELIWISLASVEADRLGAEAYPMHCGGLAGSCMHAHVVILLSMHLCCYVPGPKGQERAGCPSSGSSHTFWKKLSVCKGMAVYKGNPMAAEGQGGHSLNGGLISNPSNLPLVS